MGGDRHHPLVVAVADGLARNGVVALRRDFPDPDPNAAAAEVESASDELRVTHGVDAVVLAGYSWGAAVSALASPTGLVARALVAPPASMLSGQAPDANPLLAMVPEHDQYGSPAAVTAALGRWPSTTIEVVAGIDHFLGGAVPKIAGRVVDWIVTVSLA
jgi:alpha/beta superfamily hydrolase